MFAFSYLKANFTENCKELTFPSFFPKISFSQIDVNLNKLKKKIKRVMPFLKA